MFSSWPSVNCSLLEPSWRPKLRLNDQVAMDEVVPVIHNQIMNRKVIGNTTHIVPLLIHLTYATCCSDTMKDLQRILFQIIWWYYNKHMECIYESIVTLTLHQGQENLCHLMSPIVLYLGTRYDVWHEMKRYDTKYDHLIFFCDLWPSPVTFSICQGHLHSIRCTLRCCLLKPGKKFGGLIEIEIYHIDNGLELT